MRAHLILFAWLVAGQATACGGDSKSTGSPATSAATGGTRGGGSSAAGGSSGTGGATTIATSSSSSSASTGGGSSSGGATSSGATSSGGGTTTETSGSGGSVSSSGGAGGATTSAGAGGASNSGGTGGATSGGGAGGSSSRRCSEDCAAEMQTCCDGTCRDTYNDPLNCGGCDTQCEEAEPYCAGECQPNPCNEATSCRDGESCCGTECCQTGQLCCYTAAGAFQGPSCADPVDGSCPPVCWLCGCAHPETPIATPYGEVAIAELRVGDLVYSVDGDASVVVPIARIQRLPVRDHYVQALSLDNGRKLLLSAEHPSAARQAIGALGPGQTLGEVSILAVEQVPYDAPYTYDILPASATGTYYAGGALVGSTLFDGG